MEYTFLLKTIVPRGFIFSSLDELSKILCNHSSVKKTVTITNSENQNLRGQVNDIDVLHLIYGLKGSLSDSSCRDVIFWNLRHKIPRTPCSLKKREGVHWYLCFYKDGSIAAVHESLINENNYLLAELTPGTSGFKTTKECKIDVGHVCYV